MAAPARTGAYVPPHKRPQQEATPWVTLESLVTPDDSVSVVAERATTPLVELNELREAGLVTEAEYAEKRKGILSGL